MSAPDHLRLILHTLGTGGTREMAERVHEHTAGLQRQIDGLTAQLAQAATAPPDVAALRSEVKAALGEATRMARLREATLASLEQALAGIGVALTADDDPADVAIRVLREQFAEIRRLNTLLDPARAIIREKIEASSLGTPEAVAARESVPVELAQAVVARAAELAGKDEDDLAAVTVGDLMLAREAAASVALDRDPRAETIVIDDGQGDSEDDWDDEPAPDAEPLYTIGQVEPVAYVPTAAPADGTPAVTRPAPSNDEIRAWCRARGIVVSDRGPIGKTARAKYDAAHQGV